MLLLLLALPSPAVPIRIVPGVAAHEASLGDKKLKAGDTKGAMVHYGKALKMHSSPDIMIKRATGYMESGKTEKARKDLDAALGLDPKNLKGLLKRARVHRSLGLFDLAVADYEAVKAIEPANAKAAKELPMVSQARNAQKIGRTSFETAQAARGTGDAAGAKRLYKEAHYNLGNNLKQRGDVAGAEDAYRAAIATDPQYARAHLNLGCMLGNRGDHAGAAASFAKAVQIDPSHPNAQQCLTQMLAAVRQSRSRRTSKH